MQLADAGFLTPQCTDPAYAEHMATLCERERVDLVVPTIDPELPVWAGLRHALAAAGTTVAVSAPAVIDIAADKRHINRHCRRYGLPCPRQGSVADVLADPSSWDWPVIAKPARGSSAAGLRRITGRAELELLAADPDLVVEEVAPGVEYTVDIYVDRDGAAHAPVARRRLAVRGGEVSQAVVVRDGALQTLTTKVVETLPGAFGVLNVQLFSDGREASVIEINARFGGGYPLTWRAGGRYGEWLVREIAYDQPPPPEPSIEDGLMMLRFDEEVFVPYAGG
jgi:carbamoyl-phosphate synthase large subunit